MNVRNLADLHRRQAERYGPRAALRHKRHGLYRDLSWADYLRASLACAASLIEAGVRPGDRVGMLAENRLEWLLADMGILAAGAVNVPAHAPLAPKQAQFQFADAGVCWLFVSTREQLDKVRQVRGELPALRGVVIFDDLPTGWHGRETVPQQGSTGWHGRETVPQQGESVPQQGETVPQQGETVPQQGSTGWHGRETVPQQEDALPWTGFLAQGLRHLDRYMPELERRRLDRGQDDLATIMYTSGTTGNPKGVMLSHGNLLSNALSMVEGGEFRDDTVVLSWLPYSHIYGRLVDHYVSLAAGATLCLAESQETLVRNLDEIQPTCFSAVPRFYEKVYTAVQCDDPERTLRRLRDLFGPRIRWLNSGGAPLPLHLAQAYQDAGLTMLQGYGLTESSPVITFNRREANRLGTVGQAVPGVEVRIAPDGEVLTRGPHVMKGYWNQPQATAEAIRDGWLHTGDLGRLDDGYLSITGRKKDLLVLSNGKKVVPTYLEGLLLADPCIDQVVICGEGKNYLTALVVPNFENLRAAAQELGITEPDNARLVRLPEVHALMARRAEAALAAVSAWEQVRKFILLSRPFTLEADEMTVSLKLRRGTIVQKYRQQWEGLYTE
jgi:long-chain acyl-CoA synthetase